MLLIARLVSRVTVLPMTATLATGDIIGGRYRIDEPLAQGGMARVFLATDEPTRERVIIKQLMLSGAASLHAFREEFAVLSSLSHPCLTHVLDYGVVRLHGEALHYYAARWVPGQTLRQTSSSDRAIAAVMDAMDGLAALHELGMCHGDFTPDNVVVQENGRAVLIDLGCVRRFDDDSEALSGTAGFMAPELLASGRGSARTDLFAVGATLQAVCSPESSTRVKALIRALLSPDPSQRPANVAEALEALGRQARRTTSVRVLAAKMVGRNDEMTRLGEWFALLQARGHGPRVLSLCGPSGVGMTRLLREGLARIEFDVFRARGSDPSAARFLLSRACGTDELLEGARGGLSAAQILSARAEPLLLVVEDIDRISEPADRDLLLAFARALEPTGMVALLVTCEAAPPDVATSTLAIAPLDLDALREWTAGTLSGGALNDLLVSTGGLPAQVQTYLASLSRLRGDEPAELAGNAPLASRIIARCSVQELEQLALVVALGGQGDLNRLGVEDLAASELFERRVFSRDASRVRLASLGLVDPLSNALPPDVLRAAHGRILKQLTLEEESDTEGEEHCASLIEHAVLAGELSRAEREFAQSSDLWRRAPRRFLSCARRLQERTKDEQTLANIAELALAAGEPRLSLLSSIPLVRRRRGVLSRAHLLAADAQIRLGRPIRAQRLLGRITASDTASPLLAAGLERLARARIQLGDFSGAEGAARCGLKLPSDRDVTRALNEAIGVAQTYLGRIGEAEEHFIVALRELGKDGEPRAHCRLLAQRAICAFRTGRAAEAAECHAAALAIAERFALDDLVAVCALNLGTAQQELADLGGALANYGRGLAMARAVGRKNTQLTLRFNLANVCAEIGDFEQAEAYLATLEVAAESGGVGQLKLGVTLVRAELGLARGDVAAAEGACDDAASRLAGGHEARETVELSLCRASLELARGRAAEARLTATNAEVAAERVAATDLSLRARVIIARAVCALGAVEGLEKLSELEELARTAGHTLIAARVATERAEAARSLTHASAASLAERARRIWDKIAATLPVAMRENFWRDPRRAALIPVTRGFDLASKSSAIEDTRFRRLLSLARRVNSTLALDRVMEYALDAAIELSGAERGFLISCEGAETRIACGRHGQGEPPSQSVLTRVLTTEEPVLATDIASDPRFAAGGSIHALRLKSVLCVPIAAPGGTVGAFYVDSRVQRARFTEAERDLLITLADQVAVALENARLHAELERRGAELEQQKRTIERLSRGKDREIERLRHRVDSQQQSLELKYDYSQIVGRSAAMRAVLVALDRIVDTGASVLIQGESGTGKELVARALHFNSSRKAAPFLAINCGALPESLLETELFGHVRGAFTGADRDKRGLLLAAQGGTLFLDEIGEMPLSTQVKLLRVLQEREVRPLGSERSSPIDVRVVAATHRELLIEMAEERFREDLYYRVAVVTVRLPPLRERPEDLFELAKAHLANVARDAHKAPPELSLQARRRLLAHPWPGNVRELQNALTRAFIMSNGSRIGVNDLDLGNRTERVSIRRSSSRKDFETQERVRILDLLQATRWNVSEVARALALPRNTVYRKLARYGLVRDPAKG
jgi:serine/threonine-protein kinase PknK